MFLFQSSPECPSTQSSTECEKDKQDMEAIRTLHLMIDDDHNGNVDQSESDEVSLELYRQ